jgi:hypothetical protein
MDSTRSSDYDASVLDPPYAGDNQTISEQPVLRRNVAVGPATVTGENMLPARNRIQWGPIMAGLLTTIAAMLVLTVLGLAIGTTAFEPRDPGESIGTAAAIWGGVSAILAFFLGGWVAAKTAAVGGGFSGLMQGLLVGATALALILYLTGSGLGNLFGTIGANIGDIANVAQDTAQQEGVTAEEAQAEAAAQADEAQAEANEVVGNATAAFLDAEEEAWGTLAGIVLALGAAALGGLIGHNKRADLIHGTG